jgi:serine/threonine protein kinase
VCDGKDFISLDVLI